jgi:hypothetical protein
VILDAAPQHEQPGVLTRVERIWRAGSGAKAELVGPIVISRTVTVQRAYSWTCVRGWKSRHGLGKPSFPRAAE